jgi:hypothetical protein
MCRKPIVPISLILSLSVAVHLSCAPGYADKGVTDYAPSTPPAPAPLKGGAQTLSTGVSRSGPLQGGIKEESSLNPSLRLTPQLPGRVDANNGQGGSLNPMRGQYVPEQIRGGVHTGGSEGGISDGPVQFLGNTPKGGSTGMHGVIPPISSYNHTPASGVINYIPGASTSSASEGSSKSQDPMPEHYQTVGRGVIVLTPELTVSSTPRVPTMPMFGGSTTGSALSAVQAMQFSVPMIAPGVNTPTIITNCLPGGEETHYITRHGITTAPGFEVTITPPGLSKETLGGSWSTKPTTSTSPIALSAMANPLEAQRIFTRIEPVATEIARAGVLAQFQAGSSDTWPQWYRAVAKSIYTHWQMVDVCPGTAKLEVTVKANHDMSGQVIEFTPAADIARNVPRETEFREIAVKIVNQLGFFEIPNFPNPPNTEVVFAIELKRTVNGPTGMSVVGVPSK